MRKSWNLILNKYTKLQKASKSVELKTKGKIEGRKYKNIDKKV